MSESNMLFRYIGCTLILGLFFGQALVSAQISNRGLYIVNFPNISTDRVKISHEIVDVSSNVDVELHLLYPVAGLDMHFTLDASNNRIYKHTIDQDLGVPRGEHISQNAALLVADQGTPIWVHGNKMEVGTTAAFFGLPVTQNSKEFFIPSYSTNTAFHTGFSVAALQDGTCLEIYKVDGDTYTRVSLVHLDTLDVYSALDNTPDADFSGYYVNGTRPMAVWGGHECAAVPQNTSYCDAVFEQVPPVIEWGTEFIIGPIGGRTKVEAGYEFRVIAMDNDTLVTYTDSDKPLVTVTDTIHRGNFLAGEAVKTTSNVYLTCSKKCLVTQYNRGKNYVAGEGQDTDPYMVVVPPLDHYDRNMRFPTMQHYELGQLRDSTDYLTIVAKTSVMTKFMLNGLPLNIPATTVVNKPDWSTGFVNLTHGYHTLSNTDTSQEYMAWVYGHGGSNTAYGYMAGYKITDSAVIDSSLYNVEKPTTQAPDVTLEPWVLGNWTDDFSYSELPQYGIRFRGKFTSVDRNDKTIEVVCSEGYMTFFEEKRLKTMADYLTKQIDRICPGLMGSTVQLKSTGTFSTQYTLGNLEFIITITGAPTTSFRQVQSCAVQMKKDVKVLSNWPAVTTQVPGLPAQPNNPTNVQNFLQIDGDKMKDCDAVKFGIDSTDTEFKVKAEAWICNGDNPEDILKIISGSTRLSPVSLSYVFAMAIVICSIWRW